jgi:hypothetical protein
MRAKMLFGMAAAILVAVLVVGVARPRAEEKEKTEGMLVHHVYFTLKESTPEARKKLVDSCKKHLTKHEGEVFFSASTIAEDLKGKFNDRDFDVCLTIVFKNKEAHDMYQPHKRHQAFIKENQGSFKKVRVFDSYATK